MTDRHKVVLVTGASSGIGAATAARLRGDGWRVETAERSTGVDLIDPDAAQATVDRLDRIDALVANAGAIVRKPISEHTLEDWDRIVGLNLRSVFVLCRAAAPRMVEQGSGAIVLIGSMTSFTGGYEQAAYAASKGGVAQLAKALSNELAGQGVRVNTIAPGFIETEMTSSVEAWRRAQIDDRIPMGRWGEPDDIADVIAFLLSDDARYVTGAVIPVDGGFLGAVAVPELARERIAAMSERDTDVVVIGAGIAGSERGNRSQECRPRGRGARGA